MIYGVEPINPYIFKKGCSKALLWSSPEAVSYLFLSCQEGIDLLLHFSLNLVNASSFQLLDQFSLTFVNIINQSIFQRNSVTEHYVADVRHFVLHCS
ncbi:hypothetical protein D3C81_2080570 [compost metagenome]